ncbi:LysR family transcriptional regulator [Marinobacter nanhaiticus D15-8W]|uniref:LysR family transcriptional regulator n=1 Tax=Marinobacter nanhaiticus D15-8W TaxID=626887 RepID=N6WSP8_9GAMM|nr:LysR family transcriptional regulator [Marinobacter nanhaiticus]ENO14062.1 LysR family transcriptional regulator [Marinobacter nanhaiticus D15-8W]BES71443.1 LysR family transcriptional regulator [Marinobacter nanhaiticus D15-8W]
MDRIDSMALFVRIVESRSFTRAANELGLPRATATLGIQQLENRLGTRLLERTTRQVRPTVEGQAFYERCTNLLAELEEAEAILSPVAGNPRGVLRVELHGTHASHIVMPRIDEFRALYPRLELVVTTGDRRVDLVGEGIDCAVRGGVPGDSTLVSRRLAMLPQVICASPGYVTRMGLPDEPGALRNHQAVRFMSGYSAADTKLDLVIDGELVSFETKGWLTLNDAENYVVGGLRGCGLIQLPRFHVEAALERGELVEVLAGWEKPHLPIHVVYPHRKQLSPRVRVFVDWLVSIYEERFGGG